MAESIMEKVRRFAGADPAVPDAVLEMCYAAAVEWYKAAGVQPDPDWDLWVFWACNLAAWMYDNRGNADANAAIPVYIVTSVHQLRTGKPVEEQGGFPIAPLTPSVDHSGGNTEKGTGSPSDDNSGGNTESGTGSPSDDHSGDNTESGTDAGGGDA